MVKKQQCPAYDTNRKGQFGMKRIILFGLFFVVMIAEVSCGSVFQNGVSVKNRLENGEVGATPTGHSQTASPSQRKTELPEQSKIGKVSLDITFEDAMGNEQKLKTEKIDKTDVGQKLYEDMGCFVKDNHFYYCLIKEIFRDKRKKLGEIDWMPYNPIKCWGKYGDKLYLIFESLGTSFGPDDAYGPSKFGFATVDMNSWETTAMNGTESYHSIEDAFVYGGKIYIKDLYVDYKFDEIDRNGKKTRVISFQNTMGKKKDTVLQGIMDGKVYYFIWKDNRHMLKSKDLVTGKEKSVMQYRQPPYNKKEWEFFGSHFHMSGENLFITEQFYEKKEKEDKDGRCIIYCLPIKEGGKMKRVLEKNVVDYDFLDNEIFYIDSKHLLHRKNLKKDTDKIISKRKVEKVSCTSEGLYVNKYKIEYDEDAGVEEDVIYYMDLNGKHEKKIADL